MKNCSSLHGRVFIMQKLEIVSLSLYLGRVVYVLPGRKPEDRFSHDSYEMSLVVRKPVFGVSDQAPHKPSCTATQDG